MIPQAIIAEKALNSKATPYLIGGGVLLTIGLGALAYYRYRSFMCKINPFASCNDKKIRDVMKYKGFNPEYSRSSHTTISHARAKALATKIKKAGGKFNDDEGAFYSVLEEAGSADNLSLISRMFTAQRYGSLSEHITYYLDDKEELKRIQDILESY